MVPSSMEVGFLDLLCWVFMGCCGCFVELCLVVFGRVVLGGCCLCSACGCGFLCLGLGLWFFF